MSHHIIEFQDVFFHYPDGTDAVNGISARILHGESVGLVGANGAGKTSLMMLLTGILSPTRGTIRVGDAPMTKTTLAGIRQRIGFAFQDPDDQLFMTRVYDDVAFGPRNYGMDEAEVERRVMQALDTMGIVHLKDRAPYKLSGGEKRLAALAAVLSMEPDILILDEPTAGLDPRARRRLIELLRGFQHTKIIATHDLDMVLELCERTLIIHQGRIFCDDLSQTLLADKPLLEGCGLEMPLSMQACPVCGGGSRQAAR